MNPVLQYRQVTVPDIDLADDSYRLNPFTVSPEDRLPSEATEYSILHPPLLLQRPDGRYIVLSGQEFFNSRTHSPFIALVLKQEVYNDSFIVFNTLLRYRLLQAPLSLIEQAVFLDKAKKVLTTGQLLDLLPLLGHKKKEYIVAELGELLNLEISVQQDIDAGVLPLRSAKKLAQLSHQDQEILAELIREFQLGGSKQQKLIDRMMELVKRLQCSARQLASQWLTENKDTQDNKPQQAASLLQWLEGRCYPRSGEAEQKFNQFRRQLQLPTHIRLEHTPSFEDDRVTLCINFASRQQLIQVWPKIQPLVDD